MTRRERIDTLYSLVAEITSLMSHFEPSPYGSDYRCVFCGREQHNGHASHADNCNGNTYRVALNDVLAYEEAHHV